MIKNIIFDFGSVLVDWNPRYLYTPYFNDEAKTDFFLSNICTFEWNAQVDWGASTKEVTDNRVAEFPEWEKEIRMFFDQWCQMVGGAIDGMYELVRDLKTKGYKLYGLSNWSCETFPLIRHDYPVFDLLDGMVISGEEKQAKPEKAIYNILLSRYNLKPEECLFIDDNINNIKTGESLGIQGVIFENSVALKEQLEAIL